MPNEPSELMQRTDVAWTRREATHLLWRTGFGASADEIQQTTEDGVDKTLEAGPEVILDPQQFGFA